MGKKKEKSPAYQWYPKDVLSSSSVNQLSLAQEGAYRRLLDVSWLENGIPDDPQKVANIIGKGCTIDIAIECMKFFKPARKREHILVNERQEMERTKQSKNSRVRSESAHKSWENRRKPLSNKDVKYRNSSDANAMQMHSKCNALRIAIAIPIANDVRGVNEMLFQMAGVSNPPEVDCPIHIIEAIESITSKTISVSGFIVTALGSRRTLGNASAQRICQLSRYGVLAGFGEHMASAGMKYNSEGLQIDGKPVPGPYHESGIVWGITDQSAVSDFVEKHISKTRGVA